MLNHAFTACLNVEGSGRIRGVNDYRFLKPDAGFSKLVRLAQRLLLAPAVRASARWDLPDVKRYDLPDVMRGQVRTEEGDLLANLSVDLVFPITFGRKRKLLNIAVFRGLAGALFLEAGDAWDRNSEVLTAATVLDDGKVNGGVELSALFTTFLDVPVPLSFGYAHSWRLARGHGQGAELSGRADPTRAQACQRLAGACRDSSGNSTRS